MSKSIQVEVPRRGIGSDLTEALAEHGLDAAIREDGEGCVLSIAAWNMGLPSGEELMYRSVAAVRVPALFDELWALLLRRLGDVEESRDAARRLVGDALLVVDDRPRVGVSG